MRYVVRVAMITLLSASVLQTAACNSVRGDRDTAADRHPLDPATPEELHSVVSVLRSSGILAGARRVAFVQLSPPAKQEVLGAGEGGDELPRKFRAVLYDWEASSAIEALIDLRMNTVESRTVRRAVAPPFIRLIVARMREAAEADPRWLAVLARRGLEPEDVTLLPSGAFKNERAWTEEDATVIGYAYQQGEVYPRAILQGIRARIDLRTGVLVDVYDTGLEGWRELEDTFSPAEWDSTHVRDGVVVITPGGDGRAGGAVIRGHLIEWQGWRFRAGIDPWHGLEIYDVSFAPISGRQRPVIYEGYLSEVVTPYGDPGYVKWAPRDLAEYGFGTAAAPATRRPRAVASIAAQFVSSTGEVKQVPEAVRVEVREAANVWRRHRRVRRAERLVVAAPVTIDNYDYELAWEFHKDGSIRVRVVLGGTVNFYRAERMTSRGGHTASEMVFARELAPGIYGAVHEHIFNLRLDMDVGNRLNNTVFRNIPRVAVKGDQGWQFGVERRVVRDNGGTAEPEDEMGEWWVVADSEANKDQGQWSGYELFAPVAKSVAAATGEDGYGGQLGFARRRIWVTAHHGEERYAGQDKLSGDGGGLAEWGMMQRSLVGADVVLWVNLSVFHLPRPEEWPLMPVMSQEIRLRPSGYFTQAEREALLR